MENILKNQKSNENNVKSVVGNDSDIWKERLKSLDEETQRHIADKYYGGRMPWKK